jgi:PEGA domain
MKTIARKAAAIALSISMTGCSFFGARLQTITVSSDPIGADVYINGERVGKSPVSHEVPRGPDLLVEVRAEGYEVGYRKANRSLSTLGIADMIGGWLLLLPFLGLLAPAAWEHQPNAFGIALDPAPARESPPQAPPADPSPASEKPGGAG